MSQDRWRRFQAANRRRYAPPPGLPERLARLLARGRTPGRAALIAQSGLWRPEISDGLGASADEPVGLLNYVRAGPDPSAQPKALFDQAWYLAQAPALAGSRWAPLAHYLALGDLEGRWPHPLVDPARVRTPGSGRTALQDFLFDGAAAGRDPHPLFDLKHYVAQCEAVAQSGENPLIHYLREGWRQGLSPHPDAPTATDGDIAPLLRRVLAERPATRTRLTPGAGPATADVTLVGYPFSPSGMGEHLRATLGAMQAAGLTVRLLDAGGAKATDDPEWARLSDLLVDGLGPLNVFCINADQVEAAIARLGRDAFEAATNVVYPAWELSRYPEPYARAISGFDEVWTPSTFVRDAIASAVDLPVHAIPLAVAPTLTEPVDRRRFGIPQNAFAVLFLFDFASHPARKNPEGVLAAVEQLAARRPEANLCVVIKMRGAPASRVERDRVLERIAALGDRARLVEGDLSSQEMLALLAACDAFVSLHRSEGFGLGMAQAMALGRPVIATRYSANLDYMPEGTALLVDHSLVPVAKGAYPHGEGQVWADPSVPHAAALIERLMDDPLGRNALAERGRRHVAEVLSPAAVGAQLRARVQALGLRRQTAGSSDR